ncbi:MAG: DUF1048 domain-containing protein [Anaerocolumna sp.]
MGIQEMIESKKEWRTHIARVKMLPRDYQIVYYEIQKYFFKVGPIELEEGMDLLVGIVNLFEEGVIHGKDVLEVTGSDVATFCDDLIKDSKTDLDKYSNGGRYDEIRR